MGLHSHPGTFSPKLVPDKEYLVLVMKIWAINNNCHQALKGFHLILKFFGGQFQFDANLTYVNEFVGRHQVKVSCCVCCDEESEAVKVSHVSS